MKIQLILLVDETTNPKAITEQDLTLYERVDILYWGELVDLIKNYSISNATLHQVFEDVATHLNRFVLRECYYYFISDGSHDLSKLPIEIDKYSEKHPEMALLMIKPPSETDFSGMVVSSLLHNKFLGFGSQTIMEKIEIFAENHNLKSYIFNSLEEFYGVVNAGS